MIVFTLNGTPVSTAARPTTTLLDWLRDTAGRPHLDCPVTPETLLMA